jgi:hypothetical protein
MKKTTTRQKVRNLGMLVVFIIFLGIVTSWAQEVPQDGKKTIKVDTKFTGEYDREIAEYSLPKATQLNFMKIVRKKLKKYGFNDVRFTEVGTVEAPEGILQKISPGTNRTDGIDMMINASSSGMYEAGLKKALTPNKNTISKFQMNFTDNNTGLKYKLRVSGFRGIKYIIKETI